MIDHIGIDVDDYERSKRFYAEALGPLGYELMMEPMENVGGFAAKGKPDFWIVGGKAAGGRTSPSLHWIGRPSTPSTRRRSRPEERTTGSLGYGRSITSTTTVPTSTIRTGTTSRRSATSRSRRI
jgi:catechol 2,3-dioxygenase-like lactoylglutathione lyase family enzyme